jgi:hypothetical protein
VGNLTEDSHIIITCISKLTPVKTEMENKLGHKQPPTIDEMLNKQRRFIKGHKQYPKIEKMHKGS